MRIFNPIVILGYFLLISLSNYSLAQTKRIGKSSKIKSISAIGNVTVKTWADNRNSAFSLTFDDCMMSQYTYALPILDQFGYKATFFVIGDALTDSPPPIWRYGYWSQFQQMAAEGHEIGAHTMTHPDLTTLPIGDTATQNTIVYELYQSKKLIEQKIPGVKCISLAYPYCAYNSTVESIAAKYFESARTCGSPVQSPNITGTDWYNILSEAITFDEPRKTVADDEDELNSYLNVLQTNSIQNGQWAVFFAHDIVPMSQIAAGGDTSMNQPVSTEWLTQLCAWLKQKSDSNEVWIETFGNVTKYIKERENFSYQVISSTSSGIQINPLDGLDDSIYNYPLTVDVMVPSGWSNVEVQQGSSSSQVAAFSDGTNNYVRIHIVPDAGPVTLTTGGGTYALSGEVTYDNAASTPLANVTVILKNGPDSVSTVSDTNGKFTFTNLIPGAYTLTAIKTGGWGGVNSTDALLAARYFAGLTTLDDLQKKAADVNNSGNINTTDALMIARRFAGIIHSFNIPDWVFNLPVSITIGNSDVNVNIQGLAAGDIQKSYIPASTNIPGSTAKL